MTIKTLDDCLIAARTEITELLPRASRYPFAKTDEFQALVETDPHAARKLMSAETWLIETYREVNALAMERLGRTITEIGHAFIQRTLDRINERTATILALDLSAPRCDLSDFVITETRGKQTSTMLDFCPVTSELEDAYGFSFRDVFGDFRYGSKHAEVARFGFSEEEVAEGYRSSPLDGPLAARVFAVLNFYIDDAAVPYIDHWHHLMDKDFSGLRRGGTNYMYLPDDEYVQDEHPIFAKIREIYALECAVASDGEFISFTVDW